MSPQERPQAVVWKATLRSGLSACDLPKGARILSVALQQREMQMWFLCDPATAERERREFLWTRTGQPFDAGNWQFIGTALTDDQRLVFHVFERLAALPAP